ncbi:MAG: hypothetical protein P9M06_07540 [Candidatus Saelkia tenebricola]|nr:hypothetical protein [Candidatus Saelkia tenebricola]
MVETQKIIRDASPGDLDVIFQLYVDYMFDSYLLKFGCNFIRRYLGLIIKSKNCISLVVEDKNVAGFIMAALNSKKLFSELLSDWKLFLIYFKQLLINPICFLQILELPFYPFKSYIRSVNAELLFISINPQSRGENNAINLIGSVLSVMNRNKIKKVKVSTSIKNIAVNSLLRKMGFKKEKFFRLFKKDMYLHSCKIY